MAVVACFAPDARNARCDSLQEADDPGCSESEPRIRRKIKSQLQPWHLRLLMLAGWVNRRQRDAGDVECRERLDGILRYYHRKAA